MDDEVMKYTIKDSVFTNLFQDRKYLIQLYRVLHPEDKETMEEDLTDITIKNVLTDDIYNDLGFMVGDKLLVLVEAQSTWTSNIIIRILLYVAQAYHEYFGRTKQSLYRSKKVKMPMSEFYVLYTGDRKKRPVELNLADEFFDGEESCINVKVKMLYGGDGGDILNQYVMFTKICKEQVAKYGRTRKAILEAIRICKNRDILKEYLESKEMEVVDVMMMLFDEQEVMRSYIQSEVYEGRKELEEKAEERGREEGREEGAERKEIELILGMYNNQVSVEQIAVISGKEINEVQAIIEKGQP